MLHFDGFTPRKKFSTTLFILDIEQKLKKISKKLDALPVKNFPPQKNRIYSPYKIFHQTQKVEGPRKAESALS
jgi:hypothetical protein